MSPAIDENGECIHLIKVGWCSLCKPSEPVEGLAPIGPVFGAKFDAQCPACNVQISEGQRIRRWNDNQYRHQGCTP